MPNTRVSWIVFGSAADSSVGLRRAVITSASDWRRRTLGTTEVTCVHLFGQIFSPCQTFTLLSGQSKKRSRLVVDVVAGRRALKRR